MLAKKWKGTYVLPSINSILTNALLCFQVHYLPNMANQDVESNFEEKVDLEDLVIPTSQLQKVDEQLTIEFTDIKQESRDNFQNDYHMPVKSENKSKCVSCDTALGHLKTKNGFVI